MHVRNYEALVIPAIKEDQLPQEIPGLPGGKQFVDALLQSCPVVATYGHTNDQPLPFDGPNEVNDAPSVSLTQASEYHVRSFTVEHPDITEPWKDGFGNFYGGLSLKGNNFSKADIIANGSMPDETVAYGLQHSTVIQRVIRASELLRRAGISTEYILGIAEPVEMRWPLVDDQTDCSENVTQAEYKDRLVFKKWHELPPEEKTLDRHIELIKQYKGVVFYTVLRAMDTNYRLGDLTHIYPKEFAPDTDRAIDATITIPEPAQKVFDHANEYLLPPGVEPFKASNSPDKHKLEVLRFLNEITLPNAAKNLAKLHALKLAHRFPHDFNVTAYGGLVDADSVHGEALGFGDEPVTALDCIHDVVFVTESINNIGLPKSGDIDIARTIIQDSQSMKLNFFQLYAAHRSALAQNPADVIEILEAATETRNAADEFDVGNKLSFLRELNFDALQNALFNSVFEVDYEGITNHFEAWLLENDFPVDEILHKLATDDDGLVDTLMVEMLNYELDEFDPDSFVEEGLFGAYALAGDRLVNTLYVHARIAFGTFIKTHAAEVFDTCCKTRPHIPCSATELAHIPAIQQLLSETTKSTVLDGVLLSWVGNTIEAHKKDLKEAVLDNFSPRSPSSLVGNTSYEIVSYIDGQLIYEATDYPLDELLQDIAKKELAYTIRPLEKIQNDDGLFSFTLDEKTILLEMLTDGAYDGIGQSFGYENDTHIVDFCEPIGFYAAFVTLKDGKKTVDIFIRGSSLDSNCQDKAADMQAHYYEQQKLALPSKGFTIERSAIVEDITHSQ